MNEKEISISILERQNLILRQDNKRVSRKNNRILKEDKWIIYQIRLYCTRFNFCREHQD